MRYVKAAENVSKWWGRYNDNFSACEEGRVHGVVVTTASPCMRTSVRLFSLSGDEVGRSKEGAVHGAEELVMLGMSGESRSASCVASGAARMQQCRHGRGA